MFGGGAFHFPVLFPTIIGKLPIGKLMDKGKFGEM